MVELDFFVPGHPVTQGSETWIPSASTGKAVPKKEDRVKLLDWRATIKEHAILQIARTFSHTFTPWDVACALDAEFTFERPKSHHRSNDRTKPLRACAPDFPRRKNRHDVDKLLRALLDALTGIVYDDDARICTGKVTKVWGEPEGVTVWMHRMEKPVA